MRSRARSRLSDPSAKSWFKMRGDMMAAGQSLLMVTPPARSFAPDEVDDELAVAMASLAARLLECGTTRIRLTAASTDSCSQTRIVCQAASPSVLARSQSFVHNRSVTDAAKPFGAKRRKRTPLRRAPGGGSGPRQGFATAGGVPSREAAHSPEPFIRHPPALADVETLNAAWARSLPNEEVARCVGGAAREGEGRAQSGPRTHVAEDRWLPCQ